MNGTEEEGNKSFMDLKRRNRHESEEPEPSNVNRLISLKHIGVHIRSENS